MLKKGFAWHYAAYDKRAELAKVNRYYKSIYTAKKYYDVYDH
jgi:hypothetical protein